MGAVVGALGAAAAGSMISEELSTNADIATADKVRHSNDRESGGRSAAKDKKIKGALKFEVQHFSKENVAWEITSN